MDVAIYTRVSLDREGEGAAVARQLEDARKLASLRGWHVVAELDDNDVSASGSKVRPGFEELLDAMDSGRVKGVIAWTLDRLTRNRRDSDRLISTAQRAGATIALVRGSDMDMASPAGRFVAELLALLARIENETKSDRQRRANLQRAEQGKPHPGRRAFGYDATGIRVVEEEAVLVRQGFDLVLAGGSVRSVARAWNASGIPTTTGGTWRPDNVRAVLVSARYAGIRTYHGEEIAAGSWPAVVAPDTFRAVRAILTSPSRSNVDDRSIKYLLTGIAQCGKCGGYMATGRTNSGSRLYKCRERADVARQADAIDEVVESIIVGRLARPDAADLFARSSAQVDIAALRTEAEVKRHQHREVFDLKLEGLITKAEFVEKRAVLDSEIEALERRIADASKKDVLAGLVGASDVRGRWNSLDVMGQRQIVKLLTSQVVVNPGRRGQRRIEAGDVTLAWRG